MSDWKESEHPRWPADTPGGRGGEFTRGAPDSWKEKIVRQAMRRLGYWQPVSRGELHAMVQSGATPVGQIRGGAMAHTQLMKHPGGQVSVHKTYPAIFHERPNNEVAVGLVAEAIGAHYPAVIPDPQDPHAVFMQYVDSHPGGTGIPTRRAHEDALRSDDGLLLGFLDLLTVNGDRNSGNWITTPDGSTVGIDGGEAFLTTHRYDRDGNVLPPGLRLPGFTTRFTKLSPWRGRLEWRDNDLSPADFDAARPRLQDLRRFFDQMKMTRAHELMMERFEAMAAHATGTERKLRI